MFKKKKSIPWQSISTTQKVDELISNGKVAFFKHSTRCSISSMAYNRLEGISIPNYEIYYLDLISYREVSNYIAEKTGIQHQSPQLILLQDGIVKGNLSHNGISQSNVDQILN